MSHELPSTHQRLTGMIATVAMPSSRQPQSQWDFRRGFMYGELSDNSSVSGCPRSKRQEGAPLVCTSAVRRFSPNHLVEPA